MPNLWQTFCLAKKMGARLGLGEVLLRQVPDDQDD
jgi:hypothetical protein